MADNRIYIKCRECGKMLFLGKRILSPGYYWENYGRNNNMKGANPRQDDRPLEERLNEFYNKHYDCIGADGWPDIFEIAYEDEPCWKTSREERKRGRKGYERPNQP